jgi:hypothetical protein
MITVELPIKDPKKPPKLIFPDCCVNCGKPKSRTWPVKLTTGAQKRGQMVVLEMDVPLCAECAAKENKIGNLTWMPFFIAGLLAFVIVFIPVMLISPQGSTAQTISMPYILGAAAGLLAGLIVGTLAELGLKMLFVPAYGKLLLKRPLTVLSVFSDATDLIGVSTRFADGKKKLKLSFANDEIGRAFIVLNPQEKP